jgi:hypothetical protein
MRTNSMPRSLACANCGGPAAVIISLADQGQTNVVTRADAKLYVSVDCLCCGHVQQEISDSTTIALNRTEIKSCQGNSNKRKEPAQGQLVLRCRTHTLHGYLDLDRPLFSMPSKPTTTSNNPLGSGTCEFDKVPAPLPEVLAK